MARLYRYSEGLLAFHCPACDTEHHVGVGPSSKPSWDWNNDMNHPTFSPSILTWKRWRGKDEQRCHSYVRDGKIQFLNDCEHSFAGKTVDLPDAKDWAP